jgi:hypothetical protein
VIKPIWALAGLALLGTLGIVGAVVVAFAGGEEEAVQQVETASPTKGAAKGPNFKPTATPEVAATPVSTAPVVCVRVAEPGLKLFRWGDISLQIPADGSIRALGSACSEYSGPVLRVFE